MGGGTSRTALALEVDPNQTADQSDDIQVTSKPRRKRGWSLGLGLLLSETFESEQSVDPNKLKVSKYSDTDHFHKDFVKLTKIGRYVMKQRKCLTLCEL